MILRLSEYVWHAPRGEVIQLTDGGRPKALLGSPAGQDRFAQGAAEGWIRPGNGLPSAIVRRYRVSRSIGAAMAEDRAE
ncbi:MAG: hypothetical protein H0V12_07115 [Chloroflexi bacterium]|nr:hypothetical protein [Chloroflexota bacterium]